MASGRHIGQLKSRARSHVDHIQEGTDCQEEPKAVFLNVIGVIQVVHRQVHLEGTGVNFIFRTEFALPNVYF